MRSTTLVCSRLFHALKHFKAGFFWHHEVKHYQVGAFLCDRLQSLFSVKNTGHFYLKSALHRSVLDLHLNYFADDGIVFYNENLFHKGLRSDKPCQTRIADQDQYRRNKHQNAMAHFHYFKIKIGEKS